MTELTKQQERALAYLRDHWPEKAAEIEQLLAQTDPAAREKIKISVGIRYKLEKFDGEYEPGMQPVEVIEGSDTLEQANGG